MNELFDNSMDFDDITMEEDEMDHDDQFNTALFGYNKKNVLKYIDNLENNIKQMQTNLEDQIKDLLNEKEILAQEKKYLETEYSQAQENKISMEEELKSVKEKYENILPMLNEKEEIERLNIEFSSEIEGLSDENEELYIKIKELHNLLDLADKQKERYTSEISLLEQKILENEEYINKLENNNALMNRDISENENKINDLNNELQLANENYEKISIELKDKLEKIEDMAKEISEQKVIISNLEEEKKYFKQKDEVQDFKATNQYKTNTPYDNDEIYDMATNIKLAEQVKIMQDQLEFIMESNLENSKKQKEYFDNNFSYVMKRVDKLEQTTSVNNDRYSQLIRDFIETDDTEEISKLYKDINNNSYKRDKESLALKEQTRSRNDLQNQINKIYDRLLQSS